MKRAITVKYSGIDIDPSDEIVFTQDDMQFKIRFNNSSITLTKVSFGMGDESIKIMPTSTNQIILS